MEQPRERPPDDFGAEVNEDFWTFLPEMEPLREKAADIPAQANFRVFVSHSHQDNDFCVQVVNDLRAYIGDEGSVWYDAVGLHGGDAWWRKIVAEVKARNVFIVVLSPDAMESAWVHDEIDLAWQRKNSPAGMLIIPLLWRDCEIRDDLKTRQIISFLSPRSYEMALQELIRALENALSPKSNYSPGLPPMYTPPKPRPGPARQTPPTWMFSNSQMQMDLPDIEDITPASRFQDNPIYPFDDSYPIAKLPEAGNVGDTIKGNLYPPTPVTEPDFVPETVSEDGYESAYTIRFAIAKMNDYINWFAIILEVLLLMRVLLKLIGADPHNIFAGILFVLSDIVLLPFSGIMSNPTWSPYQSFELTTLIAMAIYWVVFWSIRRFLRILISVPEEPVE